MRALCLTYLLLISLHLIIVSVICERHKVKRSWDKSWNDLGSHNDPTGHSESCTLSVQLTRHQYEDICPVREIQNLHKQIDHMKRIVNNSTRQDEWEQNLQRASESVGRVEDEQRTLRRHIERAQVRIVELEESVKNLNKTISELVAEKPTAISSSLSLELYTALRNQMKHLSTKLADLEKIPIPSSCQGIRRAGVYTLQPDSAPHVFDAYCQNDWTYFFRRQNGTISFLRDWMEYKNGFGDASTDFWAGNENLHYLTHQDKYRLRVEAEDWNGTMYWAEYEHFQVGAESEWYQLTVKQHSGNLSNALYTDPPSHFTHHGQPFSTFDQDHDGSPSANCAMIFGGGWWYNDCYMCNPTGPYCTSEESHAKCMVWWASDRRLLLKSIAMALKEVKLP